MNPYSWHEIQWVHAVYTVTSGVGCSNLVIVSIALDFLFLKHVILESEHNTLVVVIFLLDLLLQKEFEVLANTTRDQNKALLKFARGAADLWELHSAGLARKEHLFQNKLDEIRVSHDQENQVRQFRACLAH